MPPSSKKKSSGSITLASHSEVPNPLLDHNVVFLFIPNLIGYTRVLLAASSLYFMRWHPKYCTWLYIVSCLLDAFDGMAARRFNQSNIPSPGSRNPPIPLSGKALVSLLSACQMAVNSCALCPQDTDGSEQVWSGVGYGYRSVYYSLFALLFMFCVSTIYILVPSNHFRRPRFSLHAYV
jgi:hypothetical protein